MAEPLELVVTFAQESDGRIIAEVAALPGVLAYGASRDEAHRAVLALALHVLADEVAHGERDAEGFASITFSAADAA